MYKQKGQQALHTVDIPKVFYSDAAEAPFAKCTMCEGILAEGKVPYIIEKAVKKHPEFNYADTIFEYAICMDCHQQMMARFSVESKKKIAAYFETHISLGDILSRAMKAQREAEEREDTGWSMSHCLVKGTPVDDLTEYQFAGHFIGNQMILNEPPMLLSGAAIDEVQELISAETRGEIDDFTDQFLGLPPEFKLALKNGEVVLV